jgi:predicted transglutaminase-like cysteine proteinase
MSVVPLQDDSDWRLFGRKAFQVPDGLGEHAPWRAVLQRGGQAASPRWQRIVERVRRRAGDDPLRLIGTANTVLNGVPYRADGAGFEGVDRWLDPDTFVTVGGDCEDFAIAKYFLLRRLGLPASDLRLVTGYDRDWQRGHAVLAAQVGTDIQVLDNRYRRPQHQDRYAAFQPRVSFNEAGIWLYR